VVGSPLIVIAIAVVPVANELRILCDAGPTAILADGAKLL
jgi:hypothetical protein